MPTPLNNQASVTYRYAGSSNPETASSNVTTTTLLDAYSLLATKTPVTDVFRPGENITYVLRLVNNGMGNLYDITIVDDLGGNDVIDPLTYLDSQVYINGEPSVVNTTVINGNLQFVIPGPLSPGDVVLVVYVANVDVSVPITTASVTNTATVTARSGSASGSLITVTPNPQSTIRLEDFADLTIYKQADQQSIVPGQTLTYTFTLTNTGNEAAQNVVLTDDLPNGFDINAITATTDGVTSNYAPGEYTVDPSTNTLTLPNNVGKPVTVPAATSNGPGVTVIMISGTISA